MTPSPERVGGASQLGTVERVGENGVLSGALASTLLYIPMEQIMQSSYSAYGVMHSANSQKNATCPSVRD